MEKHTLKATKRSVIGRKVKQLRRQGILPANIFGKKVTSEAIQLPTRDFLAMYAKTGETGLIDLQVDDSSHPVLIHNVMRDPMHDEPIHVDFLQVNLKEKVTTNVPLEFVGEALAEKDKLGQLLTLLTEVEVKALPTDLPEKIQVDISGLAELDASIKVSNLPVPSGVEILTSADQDVVKIGELVIEEVEAPPAPAAEEAPTEGETAPAEAPAAEEDKKE